MPRNKTECHGIIRNKTEIYRSYNTKRVWSGCLSQDKTEVIWKDTGCSIPFVEYYYPANRCFCVNENIYLSHYDIGKNDCLLDCHDFDRYNWEEKKKYRGVFSTTSLDQHLDQHQISPTSGNIYENKELIVIAARMNHLMKRMGRHVSVWFPVNKLYSKGQPLICTRYAGISGCKYVNCKFRGCKYFREKCKNEFRLDSNNIFFIPILNLTYQL